MLPFDIIVRILDYYLKGTRSIATINSVCRDWRHALWHFLDRRWKLHIGCLHNNRYGDMHFSYSKQCFVATCQVEYKEGRWHYALRPEAGAIYYSRDAYGIGHCEEIPLKTVTSDHELDFCVSDERHIYIFFRTVEASNMVLFHYYLTPDCQVGDWLTSVIGLKRQPLIE